MKNRVLISALWLGLGALVVACDDDDPTGPATETFTATLNGQNERPDPRTTPGAGTASFTLRRDTLRWTIAMTNMTNVTAAHIHIGGPNEFGGVILGLTGATGTFTNSLITGLIAAEDFTAPGSPNEDVTFDSLLVLMRTNGSYVNVHTTDGVAPTNTGPGDFPGGEIRGQVQKVN